MNTWRTLARVAFSALGMFLGIMAATAYMQDHTYHKYKCAFYGYDHRTVFHNFRITAECIDVIELETDNGPTTTTDK